jgi:hypothetical protein
MLARAEAPAAYRKNERREKPLQAMGSSEVCMELTPSDEIGLGWRLL